MERKQENQLSIIPSQNKSLKKTSTLPTHTSHDEYDKNDSFSETLFAASVSLLVFIFLVIPVMSSALYLTKRNHGKMGAVFT